jgi:hypothetical protein
LTGRWFPEMKTVIASLRHLLQEVAELGPRRAAYRIRYELGKTLGANRVSLADADSVLNSRSLANNPVAGHWTRHLPYADGLAVSAALRDRIGRNSLLDLRQIADDAAAGRIRCFMRWSADLGNPVDWHRDIFAGGVWREDTDPNPRQPVQQQRGDIKGVWEVGRFPQAYYMARAAAFFPEERARWAAALMSQMRSFIEANPPYNGVHWESGQEIALRIMSWLFALDTLILEEFRSNLELDWMIARMITAAGCIYQKLDYARLAVYNNHLISEALGLFVVGSLFPETKKARTWRKLGRELLDEACGRQFYADGGYIQQSNNYHRAVLVGLVWASIFAASLGDRPSDPWLRAMERSLEFLAAQENPSDGRLPNYGHNDGSMPAILSTCDFSDFRPVLQTVSLIVRGSRLYDAGPWDEMPAWVLGPKVLDAPLRPVVQQSVSFPITGYHVLRGQDPASFCFMRCGSLLDRFSQIDMLQLDVWWHGQNVIIDGGSYLYNGPVEWHNHFMRTESHNTVQVDGRDQMLHHRQFKVLYWTKAKLIAFEDHNRWALCVGEHYGYQRHPGSCVHRRSVLYIKDDLWVVVDAIRGRGKHSLRLHWLGGEFSYHHDREAMRLDLDTPSGKFGVQVRDTRGQPLAGDVVAGSSSPPRGWSSRYYGEKVAVPSLAVEMQTEMPAALVSLLHGGRIGVSVDGETWDIETSNLRCRFSLADGKFTKVDVVDRKSCT